MRLLEVVAGRAHPARSRRRGVARSPTCGWARAWCRARTGPASSPTASAPTGSRRRQRRDRPRPDGGGGRRRHRPAHGHPQDRRVRPARPGRPGPDAARRRSLLATLPPDDAYRAIHREPELFARMIAEGYTGRKGKGGFYRLNKAGGGRVKEAIDLADRPLPADRQAGARQPRRRQGPGCRRWSSTRTRAAATPAACCWRRCRYAAGLVPEIADDIVGGRSGHAARLQLDLRPVRADRPARRRLAGRRRWTRPRASRCRRCWRRPPGGPSTGSRTASSVPDHRTAPTPTWPRPDGVLLLSDIKRAAKPVARNGSAALWDIGDGVAVPGVHRQDERARHRRHGAARAKAIDLIGDGQGDWKALVVHNEGDNFSVGANLGLALFAVNIALWPRSSRSSSGARRPTRR